MGLTVHQIAEQLGCPFQGDGDCVIRGVAPLDQAQADQVSFLANPKYEKLLDQTKAGCVIIAQALGKDREGTFLLAKNPYYIFARVAQLFYTPTPTPDGVSDQVICAEDVRLGEDVSLFPFVYLARGVSVGDRVTLYPHVFIGSNSTIGEDSVIYPNVTVRENVTIGKRVIVHSGTVIGSDGYGYATEAGIHHKIPQVGEVIIEDDVELGAGVTIDRGTLGPTRIGKGTKLDNQVHIAHNVTIGENSLLIAQVGISGSTKIGKSVTIAGQSGCVGHITLGDRVTVAGKTAVTKSVPPGQTVSALYPAREHRRTLRIFAALNHLPELIKRVAFLEKLLTKRGNCCSSPTPDPESNCE